MFNLKPKTPKIGDPPKMLAKLKKTKEKKKSSGHPYPNEIKKSN